MYRSFQSDDGLSQSQCASRSVVLWCTNVTCRILLGLSDSCVANLYLRGSERVEIDAALGGGNRRNVKVGDLEGATKVADEIIDLIEPK